MIILSPAYLESSFLPPSILHGYQTKPNCLLTTTLFVIASYFSPASLTEGKAISVN